MLLEKHSSREARHRDPRQASSGTCWTNCTEVCKRVTVQVQDMRIPRIHRACRLGLGPLEALLAVVNLGD